MGGNACSRGVILLLLLAATAECRAQTRGQLVWRSMEEARADARETGQPILAYVTAPWCAVCYRLERDVFPSLKKEMQAFVTAEIDISDRPDPGTAGAVADALFDRLRRLGLETPPTFLVLTPAGELTASARGFLSRTELREFLRGAVGAR